MSFDQKCFDLAGHFLPNATVVVKSELAQDVQNIVEDFLRNIEERTQVAWSKPACSHWPGQTRCEWCDLGRE
jgi:hypothetical protein